MSAWMPRPAAAASSRFRASAPSSLPIDRPAAEAAAVVDFWREAGPSLWFAKDDAFDRGFRERFLRAHEAAARGELARLAGDAETARWRC